MRKKKKYHLPDAFARDLRAFSNKYEMKSFSNLNGIAGFFQSGLEDIQ